MKDFSRYEKQIKLPNFGIEAQQKLAAAKVLVVGAGGLGCPLLQQLAMSGIGSIGIMDDDKVALNNLQRQTLYDETSIGCHKVQVAATKLRAMNKDISVEEYCIRVDNKVDIAIIDKYDIVVDCTDNFESRYLLNDLCLLLGKTLVYASLYRHEGQLAVFNAARSTNSRTANYRDLFPQAPQANEVSDCNEIGVLGALCSIMGSLQAAEVIKLITHISEPLCDQLLLFNLLDNSTQRLDYKSRGIQIDYPKSIEEIRSYDYSVFCHLNDQAIDSKEQLSKLLAEASMMLIDVRNIEEEPRINGRKHINIPLAEIEEYWNQIEAYEKLIFICQSGARSKKALNLAKQKFPEKEMYYYAGELALTKELQE